MNILIDTHIFLWSLSSPERLAEKRRFELESPANEVYLSSMSIAELMIKQVVGKIQIDFNPLEMARKVGFQLLDFSGADALFLCEMPLHHRDPFDRMIIAQSLVNGFPIMTDDAKFQKYACKVI
ncbi:MAG: type II toxin-antitoxin system VapC family toxin [Desulfococcaceae bacterium]